MKFKPHDAHLKNEQHMFFATKNILPGMGGLREGGRGRGSLKTILFQAIACSDACKNHRDSSFT